MGCKKYLIKFLQNSLKEIVKIEIPSGTQESKGWHFLKLNTVRTFYNSQKYVRLNKLVLFPNILNSFNSDISQTGSMTFWNKDFTLVLAYLRLLKKM